jgi:hypothetical protein
LTRKAECEITLDRRQSERPGNARTAIFAIHVGFTNTGTTSLQPNFFSHRDDIFYLETQRGYLGLSPWLT